jgi:hypothetical protein
MGRAEHQAIEKPQAEAWGWVKISDCAEVFAKQTIQPKAPPQFRASGVTNQSS